MDNRKTKIVFIQQQLVCGGAEKALYDLICLLDKSRFDITVLSLCDGGEWEEKFQNAGIRVVNLFVQRKRGCSAAQFIRHQLRKLKIRLVLWRNERKLLEMLFPEGIDLVVSYSTWEFDAIALPSITKSIKYVHGNIATNENYCRDILRIRDILPEFHRIICVSEESRCSFKRMTGVENNVEMHFNPLNSAEVSQKADQFVELPKDVPYLCAVGRLAPEKGFDRLIRIHKRILDAGINHKLIIVGDGPEKDRLMQTVQETKTSESVIMAGYQSNPYPYMKHSHFLVCSSFTEGLPVIAMEALSLGVPIVSAVPSIAEAFGDEFCGIISDNDDESLECAIHKMLSDGSVYEKAKQGAQKRSLFFDGKCMVKEIEDLFASLTEGN